MTQKKQNPVQAGYGSSYSKVQTKGQDKKSSGIDAVLGGQVWRIKPDEQAKAENPCLWMQAGVVKFKTCTNFYDCMSCKYDQAMHRKAGEGKQLSWQEAMRRQPDMHRVCRHSLTNRIPNRICPFHYACATCDFDQYFEDVLSPKTRSIPREIQTVKGFDLPLGHYFHQGHTWARIESGGQIRIGMDDFALKIFGRMDGFDLPLMGKVLEKSQACWGLNRQGNLADVLSPVDGVITEVNPLVRDHPDQVNQDPYGQGWLFLVHHPDIKKNVKELMIDESSLAWVDQEVTVLESMLEKTAGPLAADGGQLQPDVFGNCPELGWDNLRAAFLKT